MGHQLKNKRALITGGSRGIGAAIVRRLAHDSADVAFTYVSRPDRTVVINVRAVFVAIQAVVKHTWQ